jgi:hypothetical protein
MIDLGKPWLGCTYLIRVPKESVAILVSAHFRFCLVSYFISSQVATKVIPYTHTFYVYSQKTYIIPITMEWSKQTYNQQYEKWVPWLEDVYLRWFTKDNKTSYTAKRMMIPLLLLSPSYPSTLLHR